MFNIKDLTFLIGAILAFSILYIFIKQYKKGQKIEQELKKAGVKQTSLTVPKPLLQWFILTIVSLTLVGFLLGYYVGSHGNPVLTQEDVINELQNNTYLQTTYPNTTFEIIYYNPITKKWIVSASNQKHQLYIEFDDWLNEISLIQAFPTK